MFRRILISGAPGAGKSTCLGLLKGRFEGTGLTGFDVE